MIQSIFEKIFGTPSERTLKRYRPLLEQSNAFEAEVKALSDADFPLRTAALKARVAEMFSAITIPENDDDSSTATLETIGRTGSLISNECPRLAPEAGA